MASFLTMMVCNHHGNHIMMKVVGKCEESGTCEFRFENTLGRETLYFFGESGCCDRRRRVSVSAVSRFHQGKWSTKCAQDCCQSSNLYKNRKNLMGLEHFWKMGSTKCAQACSSISHKNRKKTAGLGALLDDEVNKMCTTL